MFPLVRREHYSIEVVTIIDRIIALPATDKEKVKRILTVIKHMKEEGKTETDIEVITSVVELERVIGK